MQEQEIACLGAREQSPVVYDVAWITEPDLGDLDALALLALAALRHRRRLVLVGAAHELHELVAFAGLRGILPLARPSIVETQRQAEQREEAVGVEEEGDADDPPA
jgi:hypothetical protein